MYTSTISSKKKFYLFFFRDNMKSHFSFYINPFSFVMLKSVSQNYPNCIQYAFHSRSSPVGSMDIHLLRKLSLGGWVPLSDYSNHKNYQLCSPSIWQIQREVWDVKWIYLSVWVAFLYTFVVAFFPSRITRTSRKGRLISDSSSRVNWMDAWMLAVEMLLEYI